MSTEDENLNETVLNIQQRQKRAMVFRRNRAKIVRAKAIAQKRLAPEKNIKKRAYALARQMVRRRVAGKRGAEYEQLGPSEKMMVDRALEGKQKLIQKIALRLIPRVKQAEQKRLAAFVKGQALQNHGQPEGKTKVQEDINSLFMESFPPYAERSKRAQPKEVVNDDEDNKQAPGKAVKGNKNIIQYSKFGEERDLASSVYKAISKKAVKAGIEEEVLGEVYNRGMGTWSEETGVSQQQYAFARVNSYINQGKTYFNEDADLREYINPYHVYTVGKHLIDNPKQAAAVGGAALVAYGINKIKKTISDKKHTAALRKRHEDNAHTYSHQYLHANKHGRHYGDIMQKEIERRRLLRKKSGVNEDVDLHELSPATLDSYAKKSNKQAVGLVRKIGDIDRKKYAGRANYEPTKKLSPEDEAEKSSARAGLRKRVQGQALAVKKLKAIGEDVGEPVEEARAQGRAYVKPYHHPETGEHVGWKSSKGRQPKYWQKTDLGLQKAKEHAGVDKIDEETTLDEKCGLWDNIHAKRERIKAGSKERMRKPGSQGAPTAQNFRDASESVTEEQRPDPKYVEGTNCRNCVFWREDLEKPVTKEELNPNGGLKAPNDEYIKMSKEVDLATLPGKATVKIKAFCDNDKVKDWVTERMCCSMWDSDRVIRDYEGTSPIFEEDKGSKARKKIEAVDRAAPHTELTKQAEIKRKIIDEEHSNCGTPECCGQCVTSEGTMGNAENNPSKRLVGTDSLVNAYKKDTPGEGGKKSKLINAPNINESFNIAYASGVGVTLTARDLGMQVQGGFAYHPSVVEQMDEIVDEEVRSGDIHGEVVPGHNRIVTDPRTGAAKTVAVPAHVRRARRGKIIVRSGNVNDGKPSQ